MSDQLQPPEVTVFLNQHFNYEVVLPSEWAVIPFDNDDSVRSLYRLVGPTGTFMLKIDNFHVYGYSQGRGEWEMWNNMPEQWKPIFAPTLAFGVVEGVVNKESELVSDLEDELDTWVIQPFYESWEEYPLWSTDPDLNAAKELVREAWDELELRDWGVRQFKILDGWPIVHDYGVNDYTTTWSS